MTTKKLILRVKEIFALIKLFIAWIISKTQKSKDIWLISERGNEARDNGYVFFNYLKINHPEIDSKYLISKSSKDYNKLSKYKNDLITKNSFRHYIHYCNAKYIISTHLYGAYPMDGFIKRFIDKYNIKSKQKWIFLQHGITKDNIPLLYGTNSKLDLFISGAKTEYEYLIKNFHHPKGVIKYTGFCRYDNLITYTSKKQILIMPTWRRYIDKNRFEESEYFKQYKQLLTSEFMQKLSIKYGYNIIFYPHYEVQSNIQSFKKLKLAKNIIIADFNFDVQTLLKESAILITDYSSVYFDMAYMYKPILFFQFDEFDFFSNHYQKGYFECSNIGIISHNISNLLSNLERVLDNNCKMDIKYINYINNFFSLRDNKNSERVFNAIKSLN